MEYMTGVNMESKQDKGFFTDLSSFDLILLVCTASIFEEIYLKSESIIIVDLFLSPYFCILQHIYKYRDLL